MDADAALFFRLRFNTFSSPPSVIIVTTFSSDSFFVTELDLDFDDFLRRVFESLRIAAVDSEDSDWPLTDGASSLATLLAFLLLLCNGGLSFLGLSVGSPGLSFGFRGKGTNGGSWDCSSCCFFLLS